MTDSYEDARRKVDELSEQLNKIRSAADELSWEEEQALENKREAMQWGSENAQLAMSAERKLRRKGIRGDSILMQTLRQRNLTVDEFMDLQDRNPYAYQQAYPQGIENYLDLLTGKKTEKDADFFRHDAAKPHPQTVQQLRERAKKGKGQDEDIDDQLKILGF
jgi:hypothetical protein